MAQMVLQEEQVLIERIAAGDENSFAELYRFYVPQLLPFVSGLVKSDSIADEVIQETFLRLWMSRDKLTDVLVPRAWIFRIASNVCYSHVRRLMAERKMIQQLPTDEPTANEIEETHQVHELTSLIHKAVDQLAPQRKKIYKLSREQGMKIPEIAEELGISPNTVKNTLVVSLQQIREFLAEKGYDIPIVILSLLFF